MKLLNLDLRVEYFRLIGGCARSEDRRFRPKSFRIRADAPNDWNTPAAPTGPHWNETHPSDEPPNLSQTERNQS